MAKFRKKPIVIAATQWHRDGDHHAVEHMWVKLSDQIRICPHCDQGGDEHGLIETLKGTHVVCPGDWIITGVAGEHHPCKPDIFEATYDRVKENSEQ